MRLLPMTTTQPASLRQVAKAAGVSLATASRALNDSAEAERVSPRRAAQVRAVAQKLGYVGGYHRKTLRTRRAETLGVALDVTSPEPTPRLPSALIDPFFSQMVAGVEQVTHAAGYNLALIVPRGKDRGARQRGIEQIRELRIDGMVLLPVGGSRERSATLREAPDLPIAAVMPEQPTALPTVRPDVELGIRMLVDHLHALGHRELLYFGPDAGPKTLEEGRRLQMFERATAELGLRASSCTFHAPAHHTDFDNWHRVEDQVAALESYLSRRPPKFTALVCYNDVHAVSACRVLERRGLRVPADVSVTGIDNRDPSTMRPPLTSVDLRLLDVGLRAGQIVLEMVEGGADVRQRFRDHHELIEPRLYSRQSTGPAPPEAPPEAPPDPDALPGAA